MRVGRCRTLPVSECLRPEPTQNAPPPDPHQYPAPTVDGGRYPAKRTVGDTVERLGRHLPRRPRDAARGRSLQGAAAPARWPRRRCTRIDAHLNGVRWAGAFAVDEPGPLGVHDRGLDRRVRHLARRAGAQDRRRRSDDLAGELTEGVVLLEDAAPARQGRRPHAIEHALRRARRRRAPSAAKHDAALGARAARRRRARRRAPRRRRRLAAAAGARGRPRRAPASAPGTSCSRAPGAASKAVEEQVPAIAELGFDVLYLPPIHPIGRKNRKGRNNTLVAGAGRSRLARTRSAPRTAATTRSTRSSARSTTCARSCATAREHGMDVALDFAIQCSADHPWLTEHPEWFHRRPDGTLKYAENPPKSTRTSTTSTGTRGLARAVGRVAARSSWSGSSAGVKVFRVDNPHTKPFAFWEWLIAGGPRGRPRRDLPRRGVHPPRGDARARPSSASRSPTRTSPGRTRAGS